MAVRKKQALVCFDAPASLLYAIISFVIFLLSTEILPSLTGFFSAPSAQGSEFAFNWANPFQYLRFIFHIFGNASWSVFASDLAFILLLGPQLEERFGSAVIALMMAITALVSGILNAAFSSTLLMGGTGIAFMMILLAAFTSVDRASIPLSFLFAAILFLFRELYHAVDTASVSNFAHLAGGLAGSALGFTANIPHSPSRRTSSKQAAQKTPEKKQNSQNPAARKSIVHSGPPVKKSSGSKNTQWEDVTTLKL